MRTMNLVFEDEQFNKLEKMKLDKEGWRELVLRLAGIEDDG